MCAKDADMKDLEVCNIAQEKRLVFGESVYFF
jgi:hypothetical protein